MARWIELTLALALLVGAGGQAMPPGELFRPETDERAILLEYAELYTDPSTDGAVVRRLAAGTVLDYVGETTDAFGRTWYTVRDPDRLVRRRDTFLVPFDRRRFAQYGYRGALLADRPSGMVATPTGGAAEAEEAWWQPVSVLALGHDATFDAAVGITATAPTEEHVRELIELLGGIDAIAAWPVEAVPGELFVPALVPVLFQFDGEEWQLARPVRLLGKSLNLLGNDRLEVDTAAPRFASGPTLYCWELIGAIDNRNELAGSVTVADAAGSARRGAGPALDMGIFDLGLAPEKILEVLPPAPPETRVPTRVDPQPTPGGVVLEDNDARQAVYLEQRFGPEATHRLRGASLILDIVARNAPGARSAATFGVDIEMSFADGREEPPVTIPFTSGEPPRRFELPFEVPQDAETLTVRLLPLDRTLAVEQLGSVVFDRASLRMASWDPQPPASSIVLYRITASTFAGDLLHTRTPVAITTRTADDVQRAWPRVAMSDWSEEDRALVLAGEVRQGMTADQVRAAWGEPQQTSAPDAAAVSEDRWDYDDRFAVFDEGKLVLFRPRLLDESEATLKTCPGGAPGPELEIGS